MKELQDEVAHYLDAKGKHWTKVEDHFYHFTYLVEEVGELAHDIINIEAKIEEPNRKGASQTREAKLERIKYELGDVLYHILGISTAYGINAEEAFRAAMESIKQKYPVRS